MSQRPLHVVASHASQASLIPEEVTKIQRYFSVENKKSNVRVPIAEGMDMPLYILVSVLGISLCIHYPLSSQANQFSTPTGKKAILHIAASLDFELTGDTAATAWSKTTWTDLVQTNQTNALRQTRVKIMYSTTGIYCLFWCEDPTITATLQKDFEDLYNEDVVEFFFWTSQN